MRSTVRNYLYLDLSLRLMRVFQTHASYLVEMLLSLWKTNPSLHMFLATLPLFEYGLALNQPPRHITTRLRWTLRKR